MADGNGAPIMPQALLDKRGIATALDVTARAVEMRAKREGWAYEERTGRGGKKRLYNVPLLPEDVRAALRRRAAVEAANNARAAAKPATRADAVRNAVETAARDRIRQQSAAIAAGFTGAKRDRLHGRLDVLAALDAFARETGLGPALAREAFCSALQSGEIALSEKAVSVASDSLSPTTLWRWQKQLDDLGSAALAGRYGNRSGSGVIDSQPELREFVIGLLVAKPHVSAKAVQKAIKARLGDAGIRLPTYRTLARWLTNWKTENSEAFLAVRNPDAWKNRHKAAFGKADEDVLRLNQRWEFDSSPADLQLVDGRYQLIQIVDIWSRRRMFHVSRTSTADAVCQVFRRALLAWGVPEQAKIDNGRDYVSYRFTRALNNLGIEQRTSAPFSPWEKPFVERGFRHFSHGLLELLPGFVGHNVAEAQELRAQASFAERLFKKNAVVEIRLTATELQEFCDSWCTEVYEGEELEGLGGQTVFQRVASWREPIRRIQDERALDILLADAPDGHGGRTVTKKGLRVDGLVYIAPELATLIGERVQVLYDPADVGRVVVYHDERFVCIAECPEVSGVSRRDVAIEASRRQREAISEKRAELRKLSRQAKAGDIAREILDKAERDNAALSTMPAPNVIHMTPATQEAGDAVAALDNANTVAPTPITRADLDGVRDVLRSEQQQNETAEDRFRRALGILMKAEDERDDLERQFLRGHQDSVEFRSRWDVFLSFGPCAFHLGDEYEALLPEGAFYHRYLDAIHHGEI